MAFHCQKSNLCGWVAADQSLRSFSRCFDFIHSPLILSDDLKPARKKKEMERRGSIHNERHASKVYERSLQEESLERGKLNPTLTGFPYAPIRKLYEARLHSEIINASPLGGRIWKGDLMRSTAARRPRRSVDKELYQARLGVKTSFMTN